MADKRFSKRFKDIFTLSARTGIRHAVRNRQQEYKGRKKRNVTVLESFCGRKKTMDSGQVVGGSTDCIACIKAMAATASRK